MECPCGASIQTLSMNMSSIEANKRYPNRGDVPQGWLEIYIREGECKCGRFALTFNPLKLDPNRVTTRVTTELW